MHLLWRSRRNSGASFGKVCVTKEFWSATTSWLNNHNIQVDKLDEITILFGCFNNNLDSNFREIYHLYMS